jgi:hypothetical protein
MRVQDHPTWQMLEKAKQQLAKLKDDIPRLHPFHGVVSDAHRAIVKMQYAVEDRLCQDQS